MIGCGKLPAQTGFRFLADRRAYPRDLMQSSCRQALFGGCQENHDMIGPNQIWLGRKQKYGRQCWVRIEIRPANHQ